MALTTAELLEKGKKLFASLSEKKPVSPKATDGIIGLNMGRYSLAACEVSQKGPKFVLERVGRMDLVSGEAVPAQIKRLWKESGFESKRVNISIKGKGIVIRFLNFPRMSREEFASAIQYEAEKYLPFSLNEIVFDHTILEEPGAPAAPSPTMPVILVAARKTEIEKLVEIMKEAELEVHAIDVDTFACVNAFQFACPDTKAQSVGLVDFGARDTTVSILDKGALTFSRDVAFGGSDLTDLIQRKFNLEKQQALELQTAKEPLPAEKQAAVQEMLDRLFQEIKTSIQYHYTQKEGQPPLETVFISGGFSKFHLLPKLFEERVQIPVKFWDPTQAMDKSALVNPGVLGELAPFLPVSVGLAIRPQ